MLKAFKCVLEYIGGLLLALLSIPMLSIMAFLGWSTCGYIKAYTILCEEFVDFLKVSKVRIRNAPLKRD